MRWRDVLLAVEWSLRARAKTAEAGAGSFSQAHRDHATARAAAYRSMASDLEFIRQYARRGEGVATLREWLAMGQEDGL